MAGGEVVDGGLAEPATLGGLVHQGRARTTREMTEARNAQGNPAWRCAHGRRSRSQARTIMMIMMMMVKR